MKYRPDDVLLETGLYKLLKVKDSQIRISTLTEGYEAVDRGIHSGGAFSAVIPMVSLFYGGSINLNISDPTAPGQDMFVLSKGHAVASMAAVYSDLGYFKKEHLKNSRSIESILNGHPGPLIPGVHVATGPLGQGIAVAQGFAMAGKKEPEFNVFCITGDGELQEGIAWEVFMHAPQVKLDNLCVIVDKNEGQLDDSARLLFSMDELPRQIESFGWNVIDADGTSYQEILAALNSFMELPRNGKPTAIISNTKKGFGTFSHELNRHKTILNTDVYNTELTLQKERQGRRIEDYLSFIELLKLEGKTELISNLDMKAESMNLSVYTDERNILPALPKIRSGKVPVRDSGINYDPSALPVYKTGEHVAASEIISLCMSEFAKDTRVVSVDSDLGSTSGLEKGVKKVDQSRGINVGIAESNMMCIGEAYAALGYNSWVSTFCPFFDWKVLRRIAVGSQEREESIADEEGWLSANHGIDMTFLATGPNFETKTNGATHMGNDDALIFDGIAGLKIIDASCPNQLVGIMRWIMDGNKGLNYLRIMRAASDILYPGGFEFEYGKAYLVYGEEDCNLRIVSSGRGVHEAVSAAEILKEKGISSAVYDMPSFDEAKMVELLKKDGLTVIAEQNNGFLWNKIGRLLLKKSPDISLTNCMGINANNPDGTYRFLHSATYEQLLEAYGLSPAALAESIINKVIAVQNKEY